MLLSTIKQSIDEMPTNIELKKRTRKVKITLYDSLYEGLLTLQERNHPLPRTYIHTRKFIVDFLIKNNLIECDETQITRPVTGRKIDYKFYKITEKGLEYLNHYTKLKELTTTTREDNNG